MIQQMHEQHVELAADVDVNYIWFHGIGILRGGKGALPLPPPPPP